MGWLMAYVPMWDERVEKTETKNKTFNRCDTIKNIGNIRSQI